jgi:hypothetical protein
MSLEFWSDYQNRKDLIDKYKGNASLLYVLELYTGVDEKAYQLPVYIGCKEWQDFFLFL